MPSTLQIPDAIRRKIEARADADEIAEIIRSLQADGITITNDVYQTIVTTIRLSTGVIE